MYAQVIIDANHKEVDRVFDYRIAKEWENQLKIGVRVMVPFGQRSSFAIITLEQRCDRLPSENDHLKSV